MKKIIIAFGLVFGLHPTHAQDTSYVSLEELLQQVETNYPSIIQYQYSIQSIQAKADGAKSWMPPTFSTGIMNFPYNLSMVKEKNDPMNWAGISFSIEQMIPNQTKLNAKRDYINSLAEVEKSKSDWTKNELRREAKILYYNRFVNQQKQKSLSESEEVLNLLLTTAEAKFSSNRRNCKRFTKPKPV